MKTRTTPLITKLNTGKLKASALPALLAAGTALMAALVGPPDTSAGTHVWTGGSPTSQNWSTAANWSGGVPSPNEAPPVILEFPASFSGPFTNNIAGLTVDAIRLLGSGQVIRGSGNVSLTLRGENVATNLYSAGINFLDVSLPMILAGTNRVVAPVQFTFLNALSGEGGLSTEGNVWMSGGVVNTFSGPTLVRGGLLTLNRHLNLPSGPVNLNSVHGPLIIAEGTVRHLRDDQIANDSPVSIEPGGVLDLNGQMETIGALTMSGGAVETGAGTLVLDGPVWARSFGATLNGQLSLGGQTRTFETDALAVLHVNAVISTGGGLSHAGLIKTGPGTLRLAGANTFNGGVQVSSGTLTVAHAAALGSSFLFGTTVASNAVLRLGNGVVVPAEALTLHAGALYGEGNATWGGPITLQGECHLRSVTAGGELRLSGAIGGEGGIVHAGAGRLALTGTNANTFTGSVRVSEGDLWLGKLNNQIAVPHELIVGFPANTNNENTVWLDRPHQIADHAVVTLLSSAVMWMNNVNDTVGGLVLDGAEIHTGTGTLTLAGGVTVELSSDVSRITGRLSLGGSPRSFQVKASPTRPALEVAAVVTGTAGAELRKTGGGTMALSGANTYPGRTEVYGGTLVVGHSQALGLVDSPGGNQHPTVVFNGGTLALDQVEVVDEILALLGHGVNDEGALVTLAGNNSWSGRIDLATDTTLNVSGLSTLNLSGRLADEGDLRKLGEGRLTFSGAQENSYTGATHIEQGSLYLAKPDSVRAVSGPLFIGNDAGSTATVRLFADYPLGGPSIVTLRSDGVLDVNGHGMAIGSLEGAGRVMLGSGFVNVSGGDFAGEISGSGALNKYVSSFLRLRGTNVHTGATRIKGGVLIVNGAVTASTVTAESGTVLAGRGFVESAILDNARLSPGDGIFDIATLRLGSLIMTNQSTYRYETQAHPQGGWARDSVEVAGLARITGTRLDVRLGAAGATNIAYMVLKLTGAGAVQGAFDGWPQGGSQVVNGAALEIDYFSGTGNDVVLRQRTLATNDFTVRLSIRPVDPYTTYLVWPAFASNYEVQTCTNLADNVWTPMPLFRTSDGTNMIAFHYPTWDQAPPRFFRLHRPQN